MSNKLVDSAVLVEILPVFIRLENFKGLTDQAKRVLKISQGDSVIAHELAITP